MSTKVLGFIGMGNMAKAILSRVISKGWTPPDKVIAFDINDASLSRVCAETGIRKAESNAEVIEAADIVILAVKPNVVAEILSEVGWKFTEETALISIVLGWTSEQLRSFISDECPLLRVMPNTPAMVGEGMTALALENNLDEITLKYVLSIFELLGRTIMVSESKLDAATGLSGSGPAYAFMFMEALADGGVRQGLSRDEAYLLAAQTMLGSAKMMLETGAHPGALKDSVCSPGGSTIEGVMALEMGGMRAAIMEAVRASAQKARELASAFGNPSSAL